VRFLCNIYEQATDLLTSEELELFSQIKLLIPLLETIFDTVRVFKADNVPFACVVSEIADLSSYLERHVCRLGCVDVADIYVNAITIIQCKCLSTVNSIFHFAYVLTPAGPILARETLLWQRMIEIESTKLAEEEFDVHMVCVGLASPDDSSLFSKDDQDILETEEEEEEEKEEEEEEKDGETITPELMVGMDISADEDVISHKCPLYLEAEAEAESEAGLREILDQFRLSAAEIDKIVGSFQNFIAAQQIFLFFEANSQKEPI
jgi:hypothetical protein